MDGLVGDASAVLRPRPAPRRQIIVFLRPVPSDTRRDHQDTTKPALIERVLQELDRTIEPVLLDCEQSDACFAGSRDHGIRVRETQCHGLLDDDVAAKPFHHIDSHARMVPAFGTHIHDVDWLVFKHVSVVRVPWHATLLTDGSSLRCHEVAYTGQSRLWDLSQGADMLGCDATAPYQSESHWALHRLSVPSPSLKTWRSLCLMALRVSTMSRALASTMP